PCTGLRAGGRRLCWVGGHPLRPPRAFPPATAHPAPAGGTAAGQQMARPPRPAGAGRPRTVHGPPPPTPGPATPPAAVTAASSPGPPPFPARGRALRAATRIPGSL